MEMKGMRQVIGSVRDVVTVLLAGAALTVFTTESAVAQEEGQATEQECNIQGTPASTTAEQALNEGLEAEDAAEARESFQTALDMVTEEMSGDGEPPPAALWIAGRAELRLENYARADSLLDQFTNALPGCGQFADQVREQVWAELFNTAIEAYQAGDQAGALESFDDANLVWDDPRSLSNAAVMHQNQQNYEEAEDLWRRTAEAAEDPEQQASAVASLARILEAQGENEEAVQMYEDYLADNPGATEIRVNYAATLISQGSAEEAREIYMDLLGEEDLSVEMLSNVGLGLLNLESYAESLEALQRAREIQPYEKSAMMNMFSASLGAGELERAVALGDTLLNWFPYEMQTYRSMAQALDRLGEPQRVQQLLSTQNDLPMELLQVEMIDRGDGTYVVQGSVNGQGDATQEVTVNFEFLDGDGEVVAESQADIPVPPEGQTEVFEASVQAGAEVAGFRYGAAGS